MNLTELLFTNGIDPTTWSRDRGTKDLSDLQAEIDCGEAKLESIDGILTRIVRVFKIVINVRLGDKLFNLVEDKQIFFTGAVRHRDLKGIAEKIAPDETPLQAASRAVREEIGLDFDREWLFLGEEIVTQLSPSYPGLNSAYQMFSYRIFLVDRDLHQLRFAEVHHDKISLFTLEPSEPI
jgi:NUDIX domain